MGRTDVLNVKLLLCSRCNGVLGDATVHSENVNDFFESHVRGCDGAWMKSDCERFLLPRSSILSIESNRRTIYGYEENRENETIKTVPQKTSPEVHDADRPKRVMKKRTDLDFDYAEVQDEEEERERDYASLLDCNEGTGFHPEVQRNERGSGKRKESVFADSFWKKLGVLYTLKKSADGRVFDYACRFCNYRTEFQGYMKKHFTLHGSGSEGQFTCQEPDCSFSSTHRGKFNAHFRTHNKNFTCDLCGKKFANLYILKHHLRSHAENKRLACDLCPFTCSQRNTYTEHVRKHTGEPLGCDFCDFKSSYKAALQKHVTSAHAELKHMACTKCSFRTSDARTLARHFKRHSDQKMAKCHVCSYAAYTNFELTTHLKRHQGIKTLFCNICPYSTAYAPCLKAHLMAHQGIKPYACSQCEYRSTQAAKVKRHVKFRHGNDGEVRQVLNVDINLNDFKSPPSTCSEEQLHSTTINAGEETGDNNLPAVESYDVVETETGTRKTTEPHHSTASSIKDTKKRTSKKKQTKLLVEKMRANQPGVTSAPVLDAANEKAKCLGVAAKSGDSGPLSKKRRKEENASQSQFNTTNDLPEKEALTRQWDSVLSVASVTREEEDSRTVLSFLDYMSASAPTLGIKTSFVETDATTVGLGTISTAPGLTCLHNDDGDESRANPSLNPESSCLPLHPPFSSIPLGEVSHSSLIPSLIDPSHPTYPAPSLPLTSPSSEYQVSSSGKERANLVAENRLDHSEAYSRLISENCQSPAGSQSSKLGERKECPVPSSSSSTCTTVFSSAAGVSSSLNSSTMRRLVEKTKRDVPEQATLQKTSSSTGLDVCPDTPYSLKDSDITFVVDVLDGAVDLIDDELDAIDGNNEATNSGNGCSESAARNVDSVVLDGVVDPSSFVIDGTSDSCFVIDGATELFDRTTFTFDPSVFAHQDVIVYLDQIDSSPSRK